MTPSHQPVVSIVIPCYNQGRFLRDAIDSALQQTYPSIEVIVVNDGSTDNTASVIPVNAAVHHLEQRNRGAAVARNAGFRESRGDYIIFLDADDRLLPHAVATGIEWLAAHPDWAFVTGHVRLIDEAGAPTGIPPQEHADGNHYIELLRSNYIWTPGVVMYRRAVFDSGRAFDTAAGGSADYELNIRIARRFAIGCHHQVVLRLSRARHEHERGRRLHAEVSRVGPARAAEARSKGSSRRTRVEGGNRDRPGRFRSALDRPGETRSPGARSPSEGVAWGPVPLRVLSGRYDEDHERRCQSARLAARL